MKYLFKLVAAAAMCGLCATKWFASEEDKALLQLQNLAQEIGEENIPKIQDPILPKIREIKQLHDEGKLNKDSDAFKSMWEMCEKYGFAYEEHSVTTSDGYILKLGRITGLQDEPFVEGAKPPLILQHGYTLNMIQFVINANETNPAFVMARNGYDVWMPNNRGSRYSQGHVSLDAKKDKKYWYFSWEEMGTHDQVASINYILNHTKHEKLSYMGHSEGCSQLLTGASLLPEFFNSKLNVAILLAPPSSMAYSHDKVLKFISQPRVLSLISNAAHTANFLNPTKYNEWVSTPGSTFCSLLNGQMCELLAHAVTGFTQTPDDRWDRADVFLSHYPGDGGFYNFEHYVQLVQYKTPAFKRFDYGSEGNMKRYNQTTPPDYNLKNIGIPVAIFYGTKDDQVDVKDIQWLYQQIKDQVIHYEELPINHFSFMTGKNMSYMNTTIVNILNQINNMNTTIVKILNPKNEIPQLQQNKVPRLQQNKVTQFLTNKVNQLQKNKITRLQRNKVIQLQQLYGQSGNNLFSNINFDHRVAPMHHKSEVGQLQNVQLVNNQVQHQGTNQMIKPEARQSLILLI